MIRMKVSAFRIVKVTCKKRPLAGDAKSIEPDFILAVVKVVQNQQLPVRENLLPFAVLYAVQIKVLSSVTVVPLEAVYLAEVDHKQCQRNRLIKGAAQSPL